MSVTPPTNSRIQVSDTPEALVLDIPPTGLTGAARGLFVSGSVWTGVCLLRSVNAVFGRGRDPTGWAVLIFVPLLLVGLGLFAAALYYARRRASIAVAGGHLLIIESGVWGQRRHEYDSAQLLLIAAAPAGSTASEKPIMCLKIHERDGVKRRYLSGQSADDLEWLAEVLRERLLMNPLEDDESKAAEDEEAL